MCIPAFSPGRTNFPRAWNLKKFARRAMDQLGSSTRPGWRPALADKLLLPLPLLVLLFSACSTSPAPLLAPLLPNKALSDTERSGQLQEATAAHERARSLFEQGHYTQALLPAQQAVALRERMLGPTHEDVAAALTTLGLIHYDRVELAQAYLLLERALAMRRASLHPSTAWITESEVNLAQVLYAQGKYAEAAPLLVHALEAQEHTFGRSDPRLALTLAHLAIVQRGEGKLDDAHDSVVRALSILRAANSTRPGDLAMTLSVQGNILARLGDFQAARIALEESLRLREQVLGSSHPYVGRTLTQLGMLQVNMQNYAGALPLLKRALLINEERLGDNNPEVAGSLTSVAQLDRINGNLSEAQSYLERALKIQKSTIGDQHPFVATTLTELAEVKRLQGDSISPSVLLKAALEIQQSSLGTNHPSIAETLTSLGYIEAQSNALRAAESHFAQALRIREKVLSPNHRDVATTLMDLARAKHAQGQLTAARPLYERARHIIQAQQGLNPGLDDEALGRIWKKDLKGLQDYALLLAAIAGNPKPNPQQQSAVADGFTVTQQARGWLMQAAVAKALAQRTVGSPGGMRLAKQVEELRRKRQELWTRLNELYGLSDAQRSAQDLATVKQLLNDVQQALDRASDQLRIAAPGYAELTQPEALDIEGAKRLLRSDEALVSFYTLGDRVQIWLVRAGAPVLYHESSVTREWLTNRVQQIRSSLLPKVLTGTDKALPVAFDVESAADLYHLLFNPVAPQLQGIENLIVVPDEVLLPLPFAALLTQRNGEPFTRLAQLYRLKQTPTAQDLASYAELPWLAKAFPLTILPSASALKLLRQHPAPPQRQGEAFLGFGDPVLRGQGNQRGGTMVASRGMRVAVDSLQALDRLPGTREELLTMASVLRVNADTNVFLGQRATELEVRRLNDSGRLGQAKVIAFATHGLLAGEVQGVTQPSLVLTPPALPTEDNDGLLSMDDVLQLKLPNTDWVILSACNTAGDNGSGESLSGLARAFFFAGAKALLVSQWSVDDDATKVLMGEIFRRYGGAPSLMPAKALREGMLALLGRAAKEPDHRYFAHPYAWAPFMLVGDGLLSRP
jgi:CHAT domain-containing protein/Tfp pilus assembly protein PilF